MLWGFAVLGHVVANIFSVVLGGVVPFHHTRIAFLPVPVVFVQAIFAPVSQTILTPFVSMKINRNFGLFALSASLK